MRRILHIRAALVILAVSIPLFAGLSTAWAAPATSLVAGGDPPDLTLVYTGDVIGYLDPCG